MSAVTPFRKISRRQSSVRSPKTDTDRLVTGHAYLVKRIAYHLLARLPQWIEVDDLIQAGMVGLLQAAQAFDDDKNASFTTYAGIRIRGAILDEVRRGNWTPRSVHRAAREIAAASQKVENCTGGKATAVAVAETLGMSVDRYHKLTHDAATCRLVSYDSFTSEDGDDPLNVPDPHEPGPEAGLEEADLQATVAAAIGALPARLQLVLSLYYDDELTLREIGEVLSVTESRVCQLHREALARLRAEVERQVHPA